jgi:hypothetical protein
VISSLVSRFDPALIELATGAFVLRLLKRALCLAAAVRYTIGRCSLLTQFPLGLLARSAKVDDVTHPALDGSRVCIRGSAFETLVLLR